MKQTYLKYLASRLARLNYPSCKAAEAMVRRAIELGDRLDRADAEQALCHAIWGQLDKALEMLATDDEAELEALICEMAGRVYTSRLALGWIVRATGAPRDPPEITWPN